MSNMHGVKAKRETQQAKKWRAGAREGEGLAGIKLIEIRSAVQLFRDILN